MGGGASKRKAPPAVSEEPEPPPMSPEEQTRQRRATLQQLEASKRVRRPSQAKIDWKEDEMVDMQQKILAHPAELEDFSQFMISHKEEASVGFYLAARSAASRAPLPPRARPLAPAPSRERSDSRRSETGGSRQTRLPRRFSSTRAFTATIRRQRSRRRTRSRSGSRR